jgi:hypothetical protein
MRKTTKSEMESQTSRTLETSSRATGFQENKIEQTTGTLKKRFFGVLAIAGASVLSNACDSCDKTPPEPAPALSSSAGTAGQHSFECSTYNPPQEGTVIKKESFKDAHKTVIFISDFHAREFDPKLSDNAKQLEQKGIQTQKEIFAIIEKAINDYGKVPVVLEQWTDYGPNENFQRNLFEDRDDYVELAENPNRESRKKAAHKMVGEKTLSAGPLLAATYRQELIPLTSHTLRQQEIYYETANAWMTLVNTYIDPASKCSSIPFVSSKDRIPAAEIKFEAGDHSTATLQCYCTFHLLENEYSDRFMNSRRVIAAEEEARRALSAPGSFSFIIAGAEHAPGAYKTVTEKKQNMIIVAPNSAEPEAQDGLKDLPPKLVSKDDGKGTCDKWKKDEQNRAQLAQSDEAVKDEMRNRYQQIVIEAETEYQKFRRSK